MTQASLAEWTPYFRDQGEVGKAAGPVITGADDGVVCPEGLCEASVRHAFRQSKFGHEGKAFPCSMAVSIHQNERSEFRSRWLLAAHIPKRRE